MNITLFLISHRQILRYIYILFLGMLDSTDLENVQRLIVSGASRPILRGEVEKIRQGLNPHPAQQKELNVPRLGEEEVPGMQHKYRETVLFFPAEGQVRADMKRRLALSMEFCMNDSLNSRNCDEVQNWMLTRHTQCLAVDISEIKINKSN